MSNHLPSLNALRVFESAARQLSYSRAADEMSLTQSAVSHQIKALEGELGVRLFRRVGHAMLLTEEGQRLFTHVRDGLARLAKGLAELRADSRNLALTVSVAPSLAAGWLVPRLSNFYHHHPDIDVNLRATTTLAEFGADGVELALRYGPGKWPGLRAEKLLTADIFPVCSPQYRGGRLPQTARKLLDVVLLHVGGLSWEEWFKSAGVSLDAPLRGPRFDDYGLAIQAAKRGQGVMLGRDVFVDEKLASGQLVRLMENQPALRTFGYYIVYPEESELTDNARSFRDWLLDQARQPTS